MWGKDEFQLHSCARGYTVAPAYVLKRLLFPPFKHFWGMMDSKCPGPQRAPQWVIICDVHCVTTIQIKKQNISSHLNISSSLLPLAVIAPSNEGAILPCSTIDLFILSLNCIQMESCTPYTYAACTEHYLCERHLYKSMRLWFDLFHWSVVFHRENVAQCIYLFSCYQTCGLFPGFLLLWRKLLWTSSYLPCTHFCRYISKSGIARSLGRHVFSFSSCCQTVL